MHYTTDALKKIFDLSVKEIEAVLDGKKQITDMTRLAANSLTNFVRMRHIEIQEKALELETRRFQKLLPKQKEE
jgi:hypothetical protein